LYCCRPKAGGCPEKRLRRAIKDVMLGFDYDEIAGAVGKSVATMPQVAHQAREHVQGSRSPRSSPHSHYAITRSLGKAIVPSERRRRLPVAAPSRTRSHRMIESAGLKWILTLVVAGTGLWFLFRGVRPSSAGAAPGAADRISHVAHALMAAAMAAMMWPMG
jgi:hypothetical protein